MNTTEILSKLSEIGLPENIISFISDKIASGVDIAFLIQNFGVEWMLSHLGVDISTLRNIDFSAFPVTELIGIDADGIFDQIKSFFS